MGGAELQAKKLAQKLSSKNYKVTIFAGSESDEVKNENLNLKIIKIKYRNIKILRIFLAQLVSFIPEIKKEAPKLNILLCYQVSPSGIIGLISKMMFKIPLITWMRAETEYKSFLRKFIFTPMLLKHSDQFIVQTARIKKALINVYSNKFLFNKHRLENIKIIPNGIDTRNSSVVPYEDRDGILYVGRLHKTKGIKYLISAMEGIKEKLFIIGEGPEKNNLMQMSEGLDIEFLGELPQKEVFRYIEKTKLLVLPSLSDAFPNVILEAMCVGSPIVATKVGGIADIVEHSKTGFLIEPKNPGEIRRYISILLKNEELWRGMSINCLRKVKKYSWVNVIKKFEKLLLEMN